MKHYTVRIKWYRDNNGEIRWMLQRRSIFGWRPLFSFLTLVEAEEYIDLVRRGGLNITYRR